ncbi:CD74 molecule, major histocompatibility complex, class II invariant chain b [Anarrhichthys ocellatus]|uniref:CD74 molecule, major histocompatibility complex, class II invariant chain b n=1 Tax=Anarrhichthys ocellatus TaxID=433405 RepID=UPI0012ED243D|nr:thyroglobulin-like [Anarrhichthys ocellatus]
MSDPTSNQPLLAATNQQAANAQGGRSSRAYKVAGLTLLACVLIVGQAMTVYFLFSQKSDIKTLREQNENLGSEMTKSRSVAVSMRMPMNALPKLMAFSLDDDSSTEVPDTTVPQQATLCQLEAAGVKPVQVPGFRPVCDERGLYRAQQCFVQHCWCVNPADGQQISGSLTKGHASCGASVRGASVRGGSISKLLTLPDAA